MCRIESVKALACFGSLGFGPLGSNDVAAFLLRFPRLRPYKSRQVGLFFSFNILRTFSKYPARCPWQLLLCCGLAVKGAPVRLKSQVIFGVLRWSSLRIPPRDSQPQACRLLHRKRTGILKDVALSKINLESSLPRRSN